MRMLLVMIALALGSCSTQVQVIVQEKGPMPSRYYCYDHSYRHGNCRVFNKFEVAVNGERA